MTTQTTTRTADAITDEQITALRAEAGQAGDHAMAVICAIALGDEWAESIDHRVLRHVSREDRDRIDSAFATVATARAECARVIADAEAQEGARACGHCGGAHPTGSSCGCFDNGGQ